MGVIETGFDVKRDHIHIEIIVKNCEGIEFSLDGILDTGAPATELSDDFLAFTGFIPFPDRNVKIKSGLQSQKYNRITIPEITICGNLLNDFNVYVSQFQESWGIDALIGLDFFREFAVEVDYSCGVIRTRTIKIDE